MSDEPMMMGTEKLCVPQTAASIEDVRDCGVVVAGLPVDTSLIFKEFQERDDHSRADVKDFIRRRKKDIRGLPELENAAAKVRKDKFSRTMEDVYDEIIDKMLDKKLLSFPPQECSPDEERKWISKVAKTFMV